MQVHVKFSATSKMISRTTTSLALALGISVSHAGAPASAVTISTPSLSAVFSAAVFGSNPVTIEWVTPGATIVSATLAKIDSFADLVNLYQLAPDSLPTSKVIDAFFVEKVNFCDFVTSSNFRGCTFLSSQAFIVEAAYSAGPGGVINIAHELGHTLGLEHVGGSGNLMNPTLNSTALTASQVSQILGVNNNHKVQTAQDGSRFIQIRPIAVVSVVPEPETYALMLAGLLAVGAVARRAHTR